MQTSESGVTAGEQDRKIRRYEQRMRDLIEAYKTQTREKEALEATLKSLVTSRDEQQQQQSCGGGTAEDQQHQQTELARANGQVLALSSAISTLTEEKRKLERNYLEDKRATRAEHETVLAALRGELDRQTALVTALEDRCERHVQAQNLVETQLACVREEAERVRQRRAETELLELQALRAAHEARVALLEEAVATLSVGCDPDGKHESPQQQQQRQHCSRRAREAHPDCQCRCTADDHSRRLPTGQHQQRDTPDILQFDRTLDKVEAVHRRRGSGSIGGIGSADKITDIPAATLLISQSEKDKSTRVLDMAALLLTAGEGSQSQPMKLLEYERDYDLDSDAKSDESVVKSDAAIQQQEHRDDEVGRLQHEVELGRARMDELHEQMAAAETAASRSLQKMRDSLVRTEWAHKQELTRVQQSCNETVLDLQAELARHRNRTIALLAEKEAEIASLKKQAVVPIGAVSQETVHQSDDELDFSEVFSGRSGTGACPLYQCCEAKARMSQELRSLRRTRRELRGQLHQLEATIEFLRSDWRVEEARLTARAERAETINKMANGINMEYLRNVLLRYMGTADPSCRLLMARAIGKVLQFSTEELSSLATSSQAP